MCIRDSDIAVLPQLLHGNADAGLGIAQLVDHVLSLIHIYIEDYAKYEEFLHQRYVAEALAKACLLYTSRCV